MNKGTFRCALGKHEYSEKATEDKQGFTVHMCIHCNLHGKYKNSVGDPYYIEYYTNGYRKREVYSDGNGSIYHPNGELKSLFYKNGGGYYYNKKGVGIYRKYKDGTEKWRHKGKWYSYRPKKWDPEKEKW